MAEGAAPTQGIGADARYSPRWQTEGTDRMRVGAIAGQGGRPLIVVPVALLYILLWSSAFIATKVGVTHSPPLTLLAVRFLCAAAILAALARARGLPAPCGRAAWGRLALFGLLNCALYLGFVYESS
ncbi:MAG: EamA family transporter [Thermomicrobia bacterium]|nr:EamA family transporter [Thermomicrobia bacterium]